MNVTYDPSVSTRQRQWCEDALARSTFDYGSVSADVLITVVAEPSCPGHKDYMCTHSDAPGSWIVEIRQGADDPTAPFLSGLPNPATDTKAFFEECVIHEFGHVVTLSTVTTDAQRTSVAALMTRVGDTKGDGSASGTLADWNPLTADWADRIQEGVAEVFKDTFLGEAYRVYDNRSHWDVAAGDFKQFASLAGLGGAGSLFEDDFPAPLPAGSYHGFVYSPFRPGVWQSPGNLDGPVMLGYYDTPLADGGRVAMEVTVPAVPNPGPALPDHPRTTVEIGELAWFGGSPGWGAIFTVDFEDPSAAGSTVNEPWYPSLLIQAPGQADINQNDGAGGVLYPSPTGQLWVSMEVVAGVVNAGVWSARPPASGGAPDLHSMSIALPAGYGPPADLYTEVIVTSAGDHAAASPVLNAWWLFLREAVPEFPYTPSFIAAQQGDHGVMRFA